MPHIRVLYDRVCIRNFFFWNSHLSTNWTRKIKIRKIQRNITLSSKWYVFFSFEFPTLPGSKFEKAAFLKINLFKKEREVCCVNFPFLVHYVQRNQNLWPPFQLSGFTLKYEMLKKKKARENSNYVSTTKSKSRKKMAFVKIYVDSVLGWVLSLSNNGQWCNW